MSSDPDFSGPGPWDLPVRGFEVVRVEFAFPFQLVAAGAKTKRFKVQLSGPFDYREGEGEAVHMDAENDRWEDMTALLALRYVNIERAQVSAKSVLRVEFDGGRQLTAAPDGKYEVWQVKGPGFFIVGEVGAGEPAIWTGEAWEQ